MPDITEVMKTLALVIFVAGYCYLVAWLWRMHP